LRGWRRPERDFTRECRAPGWLVTNDLSKCMSDSMISSLAVLSTALLFGGMTLYSFGFAAFLFKALPAKTAGEALRRAFPWFYAFVIATSAAAALLWWPRDAVFAAVMAAVAVTTVPVRWIRTLPLASRSGHLPFHVAPQLTQRYP
jgi:hypothetical protein